MSEVSEWAALAVAGAAGQLTIGEDTARSCAKACDEYRDKLVDAYLDVDRFKVVSFGTLPSAIALAEKFTLKADGGDDSLALRLREHIVLVEAMRDAYIAAGQLIDQQDEAFVSRLSSYTASLDH